MKKDLVLTIDYGTQSVRLSIIDKKGNFLAFEQEKYNEPYFSPQPGYCEQNPDYYYECMKKASRRLIEKNPELIERCAAMSSTCFRDTAAYLDENYKPVRPSIIWLDQRSAKGIKKLPLIYRFIYWIIGMKDTVNMNRKRTPAVWMQENEPELYKKIRHYAPLNCYFNYKMIGKLTDSASNMIGHYPISFKNKKIHSKNNIIGIAYGIDPNLIPEISDTGVEIGKVTHECYLETLIPEGLPYITTGNDKSCEALGCGSIDNDSVHISYGTASTVSVSSKKYFSPETFLPSYASCVDGYYSGEVQIYRGYWMLKWFATEFAHEEDVEEKIEHLAVEEYLNKKLMSIAPGSDGLVLQPYWGPGLKRPNAKGSILGFYDTHTKFHIYRAIIEGIAYALKEGLESIQLRTNFKIKYLTISGGGSKSDVICQITSDIFNLKVKKSNTYECSSLGCAMALYIALGVYKDVKEAKDNMVSYVKEFTPNKEAAKQYKFLYKKVYKKIFPKLHNVYKELTNYQHIYVQKDFK